MNIDYEKLRNDLIDFFGTAIVYNPMAVIELSNVQNASNYNLIQIALKNGFDLSEYEQKTKRY